MVLGTKRQCIENVDGTVLKSDRSRRPSTVGEAHKGTTLVATSHWIHHIPAAGFGACQAEMDMGEDGAERRTCSTSEQFEVFDASHTGDRSTARVRTKSTKSNVDYQV